MYERKHKRGILHQFLVLLPLNALYGTNYVQQGAIGLGLEAQRAARWLLQCILDFDKKHREKTKPNQHETSII